MIEDLRNDIISRYNMSWVDAHMTDDMGLIKACKDNFEQLIDNLIKAVRDEERGVEDDVPRDWSGIHLSGWIPDPE